MAFISILVIVVFDIILCIVEIPRMRKEKLKRELWAFSILLAFVSVLAIMKSLDMYIANPSGFVAWIYSPITRYLKLWLI